MSVAVIPVEEGVGRPRGIASVEELDQMRMREVCGADVEAERHHGIELVL